MGVVERLEGFKRGRTEPHDGGLEIKLNSGSIGSSGFSENAACEEETISEVLAEVLAEVLVEVLAEVLADVLVEVLVEVLAEVLVEVLAEVLAEVPAEVVYYSRLCIKNDYSIWPRAPYRFQAPVKRALPLESLVD